jgi:4-amino-4-deoxy-L-arabinose transferase-like glycosyltransferase
MSTNAPTAPTTQKDQDTKEPQSLAEALLGTELLGSSSLKKIMAWPAELRVALVSSLLATVVFVPFLGAVGLWDPWETHYGEVAREMIQRNDYVHPYWENAYFFSKPAFTMWMMAVGLHAADVGPVVALVLTVVLGALGFALYTGKLGKPSQTKEFWGVVSALWAGVFALLFLWAMTVKLPYTFADVAGGDGALPIFTEWGFRLPFAMFSIFAVALLAYAMTIAVNARAALATSVVLVTMPLYFILSRQAVTDTPIVSATIAGIACAMVGLFDKHTKYRSEWWYAAYVLFGIATLAKGLLGFGVPMVVFLAFFGLSRMPWSGQELRAHVRWFWNAMSAPVASGLGVAVVVGGIASSLGKQWGTTFMAVPVINNESLISAPTWLGIMWGSLAFWITCTVMLGRRAKGLREKPPALFAMGFEMRLGTGILLFLAVCLPWYYEMFTFWRVDDESKLFWFRFIIHDHFARLGSGVHTTTPGGDFTYFIQQGGYAMFPWVVLIPGAFAVAAKLKVRGGGSTDGVALIAVLWFAFSWGLIGASATKFHHYVFPMLPPMAILMGLFIERLWEEGPAEHGMALLLGVPILVLVGKDLSSDFKHFTDLFVYNYDRPYPSFLSERPALGGFTLKQLFLWGLLLFMATASLFAAMKRRVGLFTTGLAGALVFALWFSWSHWVDLSHHWTQRDQFWRYYTQRRPGEPIAAFLMNWRGETFYSRNTVKQIKDNPNVGMQNYAAQPGRKWSLVEHARLGILKNAVGNRNVTLVDKDLNNKFVLVIID